MQEKRRILRLVLSNSVWKDDHLEPAYKKPFDFLAENNQMAKQKKAASRTKNGLFENWLPVVKAYRTLLLKPSLKSVAYWRM